MDRVGAAMIYGERLDDVGRALTLAIRARRFPEHDGELRELSRTLGAELLIRAADRNQVLSLVGAGLASAGVELPAEWRAALARNEARVRRLVEALARVVKRLEQVDCPSAAIEAGGVFLDSDLPYAGYCPSDIDVVYAEGRADDVREAFAAEGFLPAKRRHSTKRVEFRRAEPDGAVMWLEAGWRSFDRIWTPLTVKDRSQAWLTRRRPSRKCAAIAVLDPTDALVHVSLHASLHSFIRAPGLRLHVDVDRLVAAQTIDWKDYLAEVARVDARRRVFVSLAMAAGLLGTPIPTEVLESLAPSTAVLRAIEHLLSSDGVMADGRRKLRGPKAVLLDFLLSEHGLWRWALATVFPPTSWMRDHFDAEGKGLRPWALHARRLRLLLTRWRPA